MGCGALACAILVANNLRDIPTDTVSGKRTLTKLEADQVKKRLKALGGARLPIPKGVDPMRARPDRKAMRGR